ncbi:hypothetical protein D3C72_1707270 [compost metagenome]
MFGTDKGRRHFHLYWFRFVFYLKPYDCTSVITFDLKLPILLLFAFPSSDTCKRLIKNQNKIVLEISWQRTACIFRRIANYHIFFRNNLHFRSLFISIQNNISVVCFIKRDPKHGCAFCWCHLCSHIVIC